jgi:aerobic-type carbon monoxide dehydrogenase small subunit (CoxS/CutS family)
VSERFHDIVLTVNGEEVRERVDARKTLVDFLREDLSLTGSHVGCEHGVCGACTVRVDGAVVRGCLMLAVQCDGARVETIEGVSDQGEIADLQSAFETRNALQCGYHARHAAHQQESCLRGGCERTFSHHIFRVTTAAKTATKPSLSSAWRRAAPEAADEDHRRRPSGLPRLSLNSYIGRSVLRPTLAWLTQGAPNM